MNKVGLLAGIGRLPVEFARAARGMGFSVVAVAIVPEVERELEQAADKLFSISIGELDRVIATLKSEGVNQVTMLGKVTKELMFSGSVQLDDRIKKMFASLPDNSDDTIMLAFVRELAADGIQVFDQTALIRSLMPAAGVLTSRLPSEAEQADMEFGFKMAKAIGGLDIGQTVVVKNLAVIAVEAIEGTDACIRRSGQLSRGAATIAKVAKPEQDLRFDVPAIGLNTIQAMCEAGATAMVIEAGKTLLVEREKVIKMANDNGITIVAM
jgi:DUF1009 family protein